MRSSLTAIKVFRLPDWELLLCIVSYKPEARGNASKVSAEFVKNFRRAKPGASKTEPKKNAFSKGMVNNYNRLKMNSPHPIQRGGHLLELGDKITCPLSDGLI